MPQLDHYRSVPLFHKLYYFALKVQRTLFPVGKNIVKVFMMFCSQYSPGYDGATAGCFRLKVEVFQTQLRW